MALGSAYQHHRRPRHELKTQRGLREKRGLVYTVDATTSLMTDTGLTTIYFGCDPADTSRCLRLIERELSQMADTVVSPRQLEAAKRQYLGQLPCRATTRSRPPSTWPAPRSITAMHHCPGETAARISAITADKLREAAAIVASAMQRRLTIA